MSLCPSSSHQLVAAAIAFRRARRKFPKDFGLESMIGHTPANTKAETATNREGPINQAKSSSTLMKRACNSRSDHVCPASVRNRDYDYSYSKENSISCSCCRTRNAGEDISKLRDECSGGDAIDTVPSRECEKFAASGADHENEFMKLAERDRCDVTSRNTDGEATKTIEWIPQSARSFHHYRKACCPSKPRSDLDPVNLPYDSAPRDRNDKVACGDFLGDRGKEFASASCHGTSIDLDGNAEVDIVTGDARGHGPCIEGTRTETNTMTTHRRIVDSTCQCEHHSHQSGSILDLLRSTCDRCCHHHRDHRCDCFHRHCCCQQRIRSSANAKGCETHGRGISGEKAQHKSWRDQMRGENSRLYARQCYSKEYSGIISASGERNDEERRKKNDDKDDEDDEDDDGGVGVINHKDSMCILAEKYKAGRKCRGRRCEDKARSDDRTRGMDECNKSLTSEIIDQPESPLESANAVPHEGPSVKHLCRTHCESCGTAAIARTCNRECDRHPERPSEGEFERFKFPLNETAVTRCCSNRAPCRRAF